MYADLVFFYISTPPIIFSLKVMNKKQRYRLHIFAVKGYFPQNAVDMGMIKKDGYLHQFYQKREEALCYSLLVACRLLTVLLFCNIIPN
jgi:hypothetical protein